jgi:hypothetical protein
MMKKITEIDVQPMHDEIDDNLWRSELPHHGAVDVGWDTTKERQNWKGTEDQTLICYVPLFSNNNDISYNPCYLKTPLDDLCLPDFRPTNAMFMYPEAMKTLVWFATTYGGKYARAIYYRTPPDTSVAIHIDAQPDRYGIKDRFKYELYYKKDRFHVVIDGSYDYTVDYELEDKIYKYPPTMTSPVTETFSKGEVWWFNNKRPHTSYNHGNIHKINLVFDIEGTNF